MKINLAKVVPFLGVLLVAGLWLLSQNTAASSGAVDDPSPYSSSSFAADTQRADQYLDRAAVELAQPGIYVDPAVIASGELTQSEVDRIGAAAAETPGPVRILVVPADALRESDPAEDPYSYSNDVAYEAEDLVGQLYDRVGVDGTYAVLVDASSSYEGRSFNAYQFSEERPYYQVEAALDEAVDCCAPDYGRMLETFVADAGSEQTNPWPIVGWIAAGITALIALVVGGGKISRRRKTKRDDAQVADMLRPALQEEVVELSRTVSALPPATLAGPTDEAVATHSRTVLDLVEQARHRLDETEGTARMDTPSEVEEVVRRLSDARWELVAIEALRGGKPLPERTAPCFFDPRHGPSTGQRPFKPDFGEERPVPVCAKCAEQVDAGQKPDVRTFTQGGLVKPYWEWDRYTRPYVNGYWQRHTYADQGVQRARFGPSRAVSKPAGSGLQFVWESDGGGSSGGGGGGGRRSFGGRSSSRRSFGGGSSRRSSSRSGGSRKF